MTRICELPNEKFPFRYYIHDPWWINSPWYDRYDGSPCDIYLPMAISRINAEGRVESANTMNILSIDNSYGDMPDNCVNEPLPHLLKAEKNSADSPAPLVWVYPMREYTTSDDANLLKEMNLGDNYICDAINDGFPLCSVVSTDNFLGHGCGLYRDSILISPVPVSPAVLDKLMLVAKEGIKVMMYGTKAKLDTMKEFEGLVKFDVEQSPSKIREALSPLGYHIEFSKKEESVKPPTMAISRKNNAFIFSVYNSNTTTAVKFRFPLGAPILIGCEAEMENGKSLYRFSRGEQRECRIFVEQADGFVSCREAPPVNARYRRAIRINGLKDATVRLFPEKGCEFAVSTADNNLTPKYDDRFKPVHDENGSYLLGEHVNGRVHFLIGHKNTR